MEKAKRASVPKKWWPWLIVSAVLAVLVVIYLLFAVRIPLSRGGVAVFGETETALSDGDALLVRTLLSTKLTVSDGVRACGFDESVSVSFGEGYTFCFARDDCSGIWWKEKDAYLLISGWEYQLLQNKMTESYGFHWPCV